VTWAQAEITERMIANTNSLFMTAPLLNLLCQNDFLLQLKTGFFRGHQV